MILKRLGQFILGVLVLTSFDSVAQIQCSTDVSIVEGGNLTLCEGAITSINGSPGFVSYGWSGPVTATSQSVLPVTSGQYILAAIDGVGCISIDTIQVVINVAPVHVYALLANFDGQIHAIEGIAEILRQKASK